jgi:catechol 2,3-dioxygenase
MPDMTAPTIKPTLHHATFKTTRLQEMIDWYTKVVGINVNFQFPGGAWTSNDRANHRLAFLAVPGLREDGEKIFHSGLHHTAFEYGSLADLLSSYARLKTLGIEPDISVHHGLTTSLYYVDPDKNMVELQVDNFGDWDKSSEWMRTAPEFRANPIGTFFDPDLVLAAHQSGVPSEQILIDAYAGKYPASKAPNLYLPPMP